MKKESTKKGNISRRKFIRNTALAGTAFSIVPRAVLGGTGFIAPSDTLYVAGIGAGGKGTSDLASFAKSPNVKIAYLCDVDSRSSKKSIESFPDAPVYEDYRKMLDENSDSIDAVSVSTPDHMHAAQAMAAMERGKHVYVQKPLTHEPDN